MNATSRGRSSTRNCRSTTAEASNATSSRLLVVPDAASYRTKGKERGSDGIGAVIVPWGMTDRRSSPSTRLSPQRAVSALFDEIEVGPSTIRYGFGAALRGTGLVGPGMTLEYGDDAGDLRAAPVPVTTIPGLLNLVPVVWYSGLHLSVPFSDTALE